ncbi:MAG TPA: hypothetical protein G4O04_10845 [Anaerolineae bacterium]|nr:hypothetical protein [Anaerolineae bacterium]HID84145.1 hypothetical protein [Anaerolineales bacterium]
MFAWAPRTLWVAAVLLFFLRLAGLTLDTLRLAAIARGHKAWAWLLSFLQSILFLLALGMVTTSLERPLPLMGYALGFATGSVFGMMLERRLMPGHVHLRIISSRRGGAVGQALRAADYAFTEVPAQGRDGTVTLINIGVIQQELPRVLQLVTEADPDAFVTAETVRPIRRGVWRSGIGGRP